MGIVLRDNRDLVVNWVSRWTLHKWYSPGSVTTALLISLTCLFYRLSTCSLHLRDFLVWLTFKNVLIFARKLVEITRRPLNSQASSLPLIPFLRLCRQSYLQKGELFSRWKVQ
jgi:hypothetical protein